jgi:hypothetical protein
MGGSGLADTLLLSSAEAEGASRFCGNADFLAEPYPAIKAKYQVEAVPLQRLRPIVRRENLTLSGGSLSSHGDFEYGPRHRDVHLADVTVRKLVLDYHHTPATTTAAEKKVSDISGSLDEPDTSTWQIIVRLVSNAFVKAILPGFEREYEAVSKRR